MTNRKKLDTYTEHVKYLQAQYPFQPLSFYVGHAAKLLQILSIDTEALVNECNQCDGRRADGSVFCQNCLNRMSRREAMFLKGIPINKSKLSDYVHEMRVSFQYMSKDTRARKLRELFNLVRKFENKYPD